MTISETPVLASYAVIKEIVERRAYRLLVWANEGEFVNGRFVFNEQHQDFEPLLIDLFSASVLVTVHDNLSEANRPKFESMLAEDRGRFMRLTEFSLTQVR